MQQGAQLCFNGNFLVDRSEYPPLASRVLTSSGVAALPKRRDAYARSSPRAWRFFALRAVFAATRFSHAVSENNSLPSSAHFSEA
jgi:hypothetical protein